MFTTVLPVWVNVTAGNSEAEPVPRVVHKATVLLLSHSITPTVEVEPVPVSVKVNPTRFFTLTTIGVVLVVLICIKNRYTPPVQPPAFVSSPFADATCCPGHKTSCETVVAFERADPSMGPNKFQASAFPVAPMSEPCRIGRETA